MSCFYGTRVVSTIPIRIMSSSRDSNRCNNSISAAEHAKTGLNHAPDSKNIANSLTSERPKPQRSRSVRFDPNVVVIKDPTAMAVYPKEGSLGEASTENHDAEGNKDNNKR